MISGITVRPRHIRAAKLCMSGGRDWFAHHGLSWSTFVHEGYPVETIEATGDELGLKVAAAARDEADG
jgi:hypothetical protein